MSSVIPRSQVAMMAEIPQQDGEADQDYLLLLRWVQAGTPGWADLARALRREDLDISAIARKHAWRERFDASRYKAEGAIAAVQALARVEEHDHPAGIAMDALQDALARYYVAERTNGESFPPTTGTLRDLAAVAKMTLEMQRLADGQSTANVAVRAEVRSIPDEVMDMLTPEQLDRILGGAGGEDDV